MDVDGKMDIDVPPSCAFCARPGAFQCQSCGLKSYCSVECEKNHSAAGHRWSCRKNINENQENQESQEMAKLSLTQGTWVHILSFLDPRALFVCQRTSKNLRSAVRKILCRTIPDFFPQKNSFSMSFAIAHHFRKRFSGEKSIVVAGGSPSFNENSNSIHLLSFVNHEFTSQKIGELKEASSAHAIIMDNHGGICVLGGIYNNIATNIVQRIVPNYFNGKYEGTYTEYCRPMLQKRCNFSAARGIDGVLYAIGGSKAFFKTKSAYRSVELCRDLDTQSWEYSTELNVPRTGHSCGTTSAGLIFTVGGYNGSTFLNSVEYFDPSDQWIELPPMSECRSGAGVGYTSNGYIYVVGGSKDGDNGLSSVERYDFREGNWQTLAPMEHGRYFCTTAVTENYLYVIGGYTSFGTPIANVEVFDFRTELWQTTPIQLPLHSAGAIALI